MGACEKCGSMLAEGQAYCVNCGCDANEGQHGAPTPPESQPAVAVGKGKRKISLPECINSSTIGWAVIGLIVPIVGLVLYLVWREEHPDRSSAAGIGAIAGVAVSLLLSVLFAVVPLFFLNHLFVSSIY